MHRKPSPVMLFSHPCMHSLAKKLAEECSSISSQSCSSVQDSPPNLMREYQRPVIWNDYFRWEKFSDGFPNLFIDNVQELAGRDVIFIASFHSPELIFEQLSMIYCLPGYLIRSFKLVLPYFPTGTMERVDIEGQIVTAKVLARLLSVIPMCSNGPPQIVIYDIHA
eukprot:Sdes_comp9933_c0_seq1m1481